MGIVIVPGGQASVTMTVQIPENAKEDGVNRIKLAFYRKSFPEDGKIQEAIIDINPIFGVRVDVLIRDDFVKGIPNGVLAVFVLGIFLIARAGVGK